MTENELRDFTNNIGETIIDSIDDKELETTDALTVLRNTSLALSGTYFEFLSKALVNKEELGEFIKDFKETLENIIAKSTSLSSN